jgi:hypothetical protein
MRLLLLQNYTAFHNFVPMKESAASMGVEKNDLIPQRFFDNHY